MELFGFLIAALACLVLAAVLAAADAAAFVVSHHEVSEAAEEGRRGAAAAQGVLADLPTHINVIAFVRQLFEALATVCVVIGFSIVWPLGWQLIVVSVLVSAIAVFTIAGISPRTIGRRRPLAVMLLLAPLVALLRRALGPVARVLVWLGNMLTPARVYRDGPLVTEEQLRDLVERASAGNIIEDEERDMIESVFKLSDTRVNRVMVPRTDLVAVHAGTSLHKAANLFFRSGFSRVPLIDGDLDEVTGVVYLKDVARRLHQHPEAADDPVDEIARGVVFVPDTKPVDELLRQMQLESTHVAVVVDEYGGTAGIITIEDIVEEIVGEIDDEYDTAEPEIAELDGGVYRVDARMQIEDLADFFDVRIEADDVSTVGGLLTTLIGRVPIAGSRAEIEGLELVAEPGRGRRHRIEHVDVARLEAPTDPPAEQGDPT
ncbi:hemolysin family protein [Brevibacterium sp. BRM-1]|uniref:hemolysin family protein n=1 Tax=Brevibacterium sp. BRM-1 TaxID=2999062 RepID=UPI00227E4727|nr:hemolysin family protein [Brevibacterium sp. BRM-1]WAL40944.1 hemolysin family protein [Brevibacterium sp. BRM-1]